MNRRRWLLAATVLLVVAAVVVVAVYALNRGGNVRTATVQRGSLAATIQTTGRLAAKNPIAVRSDVSGTVQIVAVSPETASRLATSSSSSIEPRSMTQSIVHKSSSPTQRRH